MKIKESKKLKFPKIMFETIIANFMAITILVFWFINSILYLVGYPSFPIVPLGLITAGIVILYLLILSVAEGFTHDAPQCNFDDLKKSFVYIVLAFFIFVGLYNFNKEEIKPQKIYTPKTINITNISIFDIHKNKIIYAIGYNDANNTRRWQSNFDTAKDRDYYLGTLINGTKLKVKIIFNIDKHNRGSLEIFKKTITE